MIERDSFDLRRRSCVGMMVLHCTGTTFNADTFEDSDNNNVFVGPSEAVIVTASGQASALALALRLARDGQLASLLPTLTAMASTESREEVPHDA